ncbi:3-hydroxybutyryl-CoA dehydrogenase [Mailhella massiliensis]|uniref:3-hydroxybutyryl-CoA dehydrogenase n=1 Tax=Mailhella massiliensis TaxID=1903261 RepID=A0A921AW73_9BACT|nr:3-hydroxybutyryl-CoA dehydrogenase [Mailhella massiliensis]HJD97482.1 3-hydroxybutyryl-CoA dehydrogenase [Mailhella massiliensis]
MGAGTMGAGIAQVAAQHGFDVVLYDLKQEFIDRGMANIRKTLDKLAEKQLIASSDKEAALSRISSTLQLAEAADVDLVIEAAVENLDIKKSVFKQLDQIMKPECILASNTSSLSITAVAAATGRADKVIGMHFFNPVPRMPLVEVIRGASTSDETYRNIMDTARAMEKVPVTVEEHPGFVVNRLLIPMINEAAFILQEGIASAEDIDTSMKLGANHPMGPLALGDLIGLDVCLAIMDLLHAELGEDKYRAAPLLRKMVRAGTLGRKTGRGFFTYAR